MALLRHLIFLIGITGVLVSCDHDSKITPESTIGHFVIQFTYPKEEWDSEGNLIWVPIPGEGVVANLFHKEAICLGYKDASIGIAKLNGEYVHPKYRLESNDKGLACFNNIQAGQYFLVVFTSQWNRYSEKYIDVPLGDTLFLRKDFTPEMYYDLKNEPWDYTIPGYYE
jgi:hypothetical protein